MSKNNRSHQWENHINFNTQSHPFPIFSQPINLIWLFLDTVTCTIAMATSFIMETCKKSIKNQLFSLIFPIFPYRLLWQQLKLARIPYEIPRKCIKIIDFPGISWIFGGIPGFPPRGGYPPCAALSLSLYPYPSVTVVAISFSILLSVHSHTRLLLQYAAKTKDCRFLPLNLPLFRRLSL